MDALGLTTEMVIVLSVLALTVALFVSEVVRVDVAAIGIMVLLGIIIVNSKKSMNKEWPLSEMEE